jgi:Tol biopolymer transport system component
MKKAVASVGASLIITLGFITFFSTPADAQYFGRNKPQYETFDFKKLVTPHFEIYNYIEDDSVINNIGILSERWYKRHQMFLRDTFKTRNPIILYNNHADFQQTDIIGGQVGVGTGGVTEGLRNRVVFPFLSTLRQTDHVLGHELVHAFQFNKIIRGDSTSLNNLRNLPLWMVEGMAEYMSIGRTDAHTAMWMRDAVVNEDIPSLRDLTRSFRYFPYRYGHAFWAFVTGVYGDTIMDPLFMETAKFGYDQAMRRVLNVDEKTFSNVWKNAMIETYKPFMNDTIATVGERFFSAENAGDMNISPVYSPDGRFVAFLSERDVLTIDIFLADAQTGEIIRKLSRGARSFHIDDFSYIENAGTFSPDGNRFAYVAFSRGKNRLLITETVRGRTVDEIEIEGLPSFNDPAWSPDGRYIALSGLDQGKVNLYLYDLTNRNLIQLTNDHYSDFQPTWSPDSKRIVFVSDRGHDTDLASLTFGSYKLSIFDLETNSLEVLDFFPGADNMNPWFSPDGLSIYFISNADGMRNLYEYIVPTGEINRLTKYFTGISGITHNAPAIAVNPSNGDIAYTLYRKGKYTIYRANSADFPRFPVSPYEVDFSAAMLPPHRNLSPLAMLDHPMNREVHTQPVDSFSVRPYEPRLGLTYISNSSGFGVGTSAIGTGFAGGVNALFTDMMNDHQLFAGVQLNGEIYDFGAQVLYINRKGRVNWGGGLSHIPYTFLSWPTREVVRDTLGTLPTTTEIINYPLTRIFQDQATLMAQLPFSSTLRLEAGASFSRYYFRQDIFQYRYTRDPENPMLVYPRPVERTRGEVPDGFNLGRAYLAYVGDNSRFGMTAPMMGTRYRFQMEQYFGRYNYFTSLADYRRYLFTNPFTFAFRGMYYGRFGGESFQYNNQLFIGSDFLVRGYNLNQAQLQAQRNLTIDQLVGSQMAVVNAEIRMPFTGPRRLAFITSGMLLSDLALFADAGMTWRRDQNLEFNWSPSGTAASPIISIGATLRLNLFNMIILEPYYAIPFQRDDVRGTFGLVLSAGGW